MLHYTCWEKHHWIKRRSQFGPSSSRTNNRFNDNKFLPPTACYIRRHRYDSRARAWQWHLPRSAVARVGSLFPRLTDEWANGQIEDFATAADADYMSVCLEMVGYGAVVKNWLPDHIAPSSNMIIEGVQFITRLQNQWIKRSSPFLLCKQIFLW